MRQFMLRCAVILFAGIFFVTAQDDFTIHVVQRGENLFRIALQYNLTTQELASLNGIQDPTSIQVGQRLIVPNSVAEGTTDFPIDTTQEETIDVSSVSVGGDDEFLHIVQQDETLFRIATQYDIAVAALVAANQIADPTRIFAGQQLVIPGRTLPPLVESLPSNLQDLSLTPRFLSEGRTAVLELISNSLSEVTGSFLEQDLRGIRVAEDRIRVLVAVPIFTEPGDYPIQLILDGIGLSVDVQVLSGVYGSETIRLIEGRDNLLNTNVEQAELELLQRVMTPFSNDLRFSGVMGLPAAAPVTSGFGTRRSYNGGAFDRYHSGTDFAGVAGTPIFAPAPGRVVLADTLNVRGNATVIDHGLGIYTGYWHQTEIYVGLGEIVETGQTIGTIGSTGRVTGAHLHWELWINGVPVDPLQWVQQDFLVGL